MSVKRPSNEKIKALYHEWLRGKTLRQIAAEYPETVSHSTICIWFNRVLGKGATSPQQMSLHRSLLVDTNNDPDVEKWLHTSTLQLRESYRHRSHHSLRQLSRYQVVRDPRLMDYIAPTGGDPMERLTACRLDFLRLELYCLLVDSIIDILRKIDERSE